MTAEVFEKNITADIIEMYQKLKSNQDEINKIRGCLKNSTGSEEEPKGEDFEEVYMPKGDSIILADKDCQIIDKVEAKLREEKLLDLVKS